MQRMRAGWGRGERGPRKFASGLWTCFIGEVSEELGNEHVLDFMTAAWKLSSLLGGPWCVDKVGNWLKANEGTERVFAFA